jgi:hypothetical protein
MIPPSKAAPAPMAPLLIVIERQKALCSSFFWRSKALFAIQPLNNVFGPQIPVLIGHPR